MKKKLLVLLCTFTSAIVLMACGSKGKDIVPTKPVETETTEDEPETEVPEDTEPAEDTEASDSQAPAELTAEQQQWVDDLYTALMAGEWNTVESMTESHDHVKEMVGAFEAENIEDWGYENFFSLYTTSGDNLTIVNIKNTYRDSGKTFDEIYVYHQVNEELWEFVGYGDTLYSYTIQEDGTHSGYQTLKDNYWEWYENGALEDSDELTDPDDVVVWW